MLIEILKFVFYTILVVLIAKYLLVVNIRKIAEKLNLKSKTVGEIAGISTSIPELLTVAVASISGLYTTSIFNVFSSNIINFIQYIISIIINKNIKLLKNKALLINILLVIITILLPIVILIFNIQNPTIVIPIFLILYIIFLVITNRLHKKYLKNIDEINEKENISNKKKKNIAINIVILIIATILLYIIGEMLGNTLENLCYSFGIQEALIGFILGFITSIPELVTFFEAQKHHKKEGKDKFFGVVEASNNLLTSNMLNLFIIQTIGLVIIGIF